jgi:hypothetical protein
MEVERMEVALENSRKRRLFALDVLKLNGIEIMKLSTSYITRFVYMYSISECPKKQLCSFF